MEVNPGPGLFMAKYSLVKSGVGLTLIAYAKRVFVFSVRSAVGMAASIVFRDGGIGRQTTQTAHVDFGFAGHQRGNDGDSGPFGSALFNQ
jgi:hypothetical protein